MASRMTIKEKGIQKLSISVSLRVAPGADDWKVGYLLWGTIRIGLSFEDVWRSHCSTISFAHWGPWIICSIMRGIFHAIFAIAECIFAWACWDDVMSICSHFDKAQESAHETKEHMLWTLRRVKDEGRLVVVVVVVG